MAFAFFQSCLSVVRERFLTRVPLRDQVRLGYLVGLFVSSLLFQRAAPRIFWAIEVPSAFGPLWVDILRSVPPPPLLNNADMLEFQDDNKNSNCIRYARNIGHVGKSRYVEYQDGRRYEMKVEAREFTN